MGNYCFYIDDTGTKDIEDFKTLFGYIGILIKETDTKSIESKIDDLIDQYFIKKDIELKSNWIRREEERKKYYLPYIKEDCNFDNFVKELFSIMIQNPIKCFGSIINKQAHLEKYKQKYNPNSTAYEYLLQRITNHLTSLNYSLDKVVVDDMTGKTKKGNEWKKLLENHHYRLIKKNNVNTYNNWFPNKGSYKKMNYSLLKNSTIEFVDSKNYRLIQIADLCAYNVMRQAKDHDGNFDGEECYDGYKWIKPIMHCSSEKQISGYGAVYSKPKK